MSDLIVKVKEIKGSCPVYKRGDSFSILEGYKLKADKLICMHSLASLMPYYIALNKGISPEELSLGKEKAYVQCLNPYNYTSGGTVIFEIEIEVER